MKCSKLRQDWAFFEKMELGWGLEENQNKCLLAPSRDVQLNTGQGWYLRRLKMGVGVGKVEKEEVRDGQTSNWLLWVGTEAGGNGLYFFKHSSCLQTGCFLVQSCQGRKAKITKEHGRCLSYTYKWRPAGSPPADQGDFPAGLSSSAIPRKHINTVDDRGRERSRGPGVGVKLRKEKCPYLCGVRVLGQCKEAPCLRPHCKAIFSRHACVGRADLFLARERGFLLPVAPGDCRKYSARLHYQFLLA